MPEDEIDYNKAFTYYTRSAQLGNGIAICNIGDCYEHGRGVKKDFRMAVKYYKEAADMDIDIAQYSLGYCYENGWGIVKDMEKALEYYHKAADHGYEDAIKALERLENKDK
mgnify:FL=1